MPMSKEDYENLITELNNPELDMVRKTDILQTLRSDYAVVHDDDSKAKDRIASLEKEKNSLVESNSLLFRNAGYFKEEDKPDEIQAKTIAETITLEDFEKRIGRH